MKCLGIDPGFGATSGMGWAIVDMGGQRPRLDSHGVITTPAQWPFQHRIAKLARELFDLLQQVDVVAVEEVEGAVTGAQHARGASITDRRLQVTGGGVVMLAASTGRPYVEVLPGTWRKAVTGTARCTKEDVRACLVKMLGLPPKAPLHSSDAVAIAIAGGRQLARELALKQWDSKGERIIKLPMERVARATADAEQVYEWRDQLRREEAAPASETRPKRRRGAA